MSPKNKEVYVLSHLRKVRDDAECKYSLRHCDFPETEGREYSKRILSIRGVLKIELIGTSLIRSGTLMYDKKVGKFYFYEPFMNKFFPADSFASLYDRTGEPEDIKYLDALESLFFLDDKKTYPELRVVDVTLRHDLRLTNGGKLRLWVKDKGPIGKYYSLSYELGLRTSFVNIPTEDDGFFFPDFKRNPSLIVKANSEIDNWFGRTNPANPDIINTANDDNIGSTLTKDHEARG